MLDSNSRIWVAGRDTMIGAAIIRRLTNLVGPQNIINTDPRYWTNFNDIPDFVEKNKPEYVFLAGGLSGGITFNLNLPSELMKDNLNFITKIIPYCTHEYGVKKCLYLASSCCYPKNCAQPMNPADLLTGPLEPTSEPYAITKIAGIKLCQSYRKEYNEDFIVGIPANSYGPGDYLGIGGGHVVSEIICKMHKAKILRRTSVNLLGSGNVTREFIYCDDLADACIFVMNNYSDIMPINLGTRTSLSIRGLAESIKEIVGFDGELFFDTSYPDGMPHKSLDSEELFKLGWKPPFVQENSLIEFKKYLSLTYEWFLQEQERILENRDNH